MKKIYKKVVFVYLFLKLFTKRHFHLITSGFIIGFFSALLFLKFFPVIKDIFVPDVKVIGVVGDYNDATLPTAIQRLISLGLTTLDKDGSPLPSLASSWEATDSGKTYYFHLRPNLIWHDGKKLVAKDIKYNIKDASLLPINDLTLEIKLNDSFSPLPVVLSRPIFRDNLIGVGIYKVSNLKYREDSISNLTLTPFKSNLPTLEYKFYSNLEDAILAFKLGEIDTLSEIPAKDPFISWKNVNISELTLYDRFIGVFFNTKDSILKDKESRQALSFGVPTFPDMDRLYTPISPFSWAYYNKVRIYKYDPETAKKMIEKTPLSTSSAEIKLSTYALYLPFAQKIADSWNSLGVNTKIKVETVLPTDYQAILLAQEIPADPDQYQFWHSKEEVSNLAHYNSPKIDKLLEDGRKTTEIDKRKKIYADFQRYLVDDAPAAFLFFPKVYTIERK